MTFSFVFMGGLHYSKADGCRPLVEEQLTFDRLKSQIQDPNCGIKTLEDVDQSTRVVQIGIRDGKTWR